MSLKRLWKPKLSELRDGEVGSQVFRFFRELNLRSPISGALLLARFGDLRRASEFIRAPESPLTLPPYDEVQLNKFLELIIYTEATNGKVLIYGDYDVDGVTSSAILYKVLRKLDLKLEVILPNRFKEGYGLNSRALKRILTSAPDLLITIDNGITAKEIVKQVREAGIGTVIIDHHEIDPERLPEADAIIHPGLIPFGYRHLTSGGIALKLALFMSELLDIKLSPREIDELFVLATISTIADVAPLLDENRIIIIRGLSLMREGILPLGVRELWSLTGREGFPRSVFDVAFILAPRLNAAGRLSDPSLAFKLLITEDPYEAKAIATELERYNRKRRNYQEKILRKIEEIGVNLDGNVIVLQMDNLHEGVMGIIAQRLASKYLLPTFVCTSSPDGSLLKGSARSPHSSLSIVEAFYSAKDLLSSYGGHNRAGGFSLPQENFRDFERALRDHYSPFKVIEETYDFDLPLEWGGLLQRFYADLRRIGPFGEDNPEPIIGFRGKILSFNTQYANVYIDQLKREVKLRIDDSLLPRLRELRLIKPYKLIIQIKPPGANSEVFGTVLDFLSEDLRTSLNMYRGPALRISQLPLEEIELTDLSLIDEGESYVLISNSEFEGKEIMRVKKLTNLKLEEKLKIIAEWRGLLVFRTLSSVIKTFNILNTFFTLKGDKEVILMSSEDLEQLKGELERRKFSISQWHPSWDDISDEALICEYIYLKDLFRLWKIIKPRHIHTLTELT